MQLLMTGSKPPQAVWSAPHHTCSAECLSNNMLEILLSATAVLCNTQTCKNNLTLCMSDVTRVIVQRQG